MVTSHVFIANALYDKNGDSPNNRHTVMVPVASHILQEFDQFTSYQDTHDSRTTSKQRAPRKSKKKQGTSSEPEPEPEASGLGMEVSN